MTMKSKRALHRSRTERELKTPRASNPERVKSRREDVPGAGDAAPVNRGAESRDLLTGLLTLDSFLEELRGRVAEARRRSRLTAVLYVGLNGVKRVNDSFGIQFGDILIRQAAARLLSAVRESDILARVGGVYFAVALEPFDTVEDALIVADRFVDILSETFNVFELADHPVGISANVGISLYPSHAKLPVDLIRYAAIALGEAGQQGANRVEVFDRERGEETRARIELEWMLRHSIDKREFALWFQPEIDLRTGRVIQREALLRWLHPQRGQIAPARFVPIAEETGLIVPLGNWVIREACLQAWKWQHTGNAGIGVAVNVSALQLAKPNFAGTVEVVLRETGLSGELLELELTESALMANFEKSVLELSRLRDCGISVVIDDFGVGYSSLSYLKELPVSGVKLDRSFLRDIESNRHTLPLLKSMVSLAHVLNMRVTAEGVETQAQLDAVRAIGFDTAQGYFLGMPAAISDREKASAASCP
jgi:diguanylate cyclase (GGDEF)-like protein